MARPPRIGDTFARSRNSSSSSSSSSNSSAGGGFSDIRGASGIAPPPSNVSQSTGGFSSVGGQEQTVTPQGKVVSKSKVSQSTGGFSSVGGQEQTVTPQGKVVSTNRVVSVRRVQSSQGMQSSSESNLNKVEVQRVERQTPFSERLDVRLKRDNPDYLLIRNALNEAGLPASTTNRNKINLAIENYLARRNQGNVSLTSGNVGEVDYANFSPVSSNRNDGGVSRGVVSQDVTIPPVSEQQRVSKVREDFGIIGNLGAGLVSIGGALGRGGGETIEKVLPGFRNTLRYNLFESPIVPNRGFRLLKSQGLDDPKRFEKEVGRPLGALGANIASLGAGGLLFRSASGVLNVGGRLAPVAEQVGTNFPRLARGASQVSRLPGVNRLLNYTPEILGGTGLVVGTFATDIAIGGEAQGFKIEGVKRNEKQKIELIRKFNSRFFNEQLGYTEVDESGKPIREVPAQFGDAGIVGLAQRSITSPGLLVDIQPTEAENVARTILREEKIPVTSKNVQGLVSAARGTGRAATAGEFLIEASNELLISGSLGKAAPLTRRELLNPKLLESGLRNRIVPRQIVGGLLEGGGETYNTQSLTSSEPNYLNIGLGALFGGTISGGFGLLQARAAVGKFPGSRLVTGLGYAVDFPGEPIGDLSVDVGARLLGRQRPGLRFPVITGGTTFISQSRVSQSQSRSQSQPQNNFFSSIYGTGKSQGTSQGRGINFARGNNFIDEFGLPVLGEAKSKQNNTFFGIGEGRGETFGNANTNTSSNLFGEGESNADTDTELNVNNQGNAFSNAFVNVNALTPSQAPFPPFFSPGRSSSGGSGGRRSRLGYFDEFSAVFGNLVNSRIPRGRPRRVNIQNRRRTNSTIFNNPVYQNLFGFKTQRKRRRRR